MPEPKSTKLNVRNDRPTAISSLVGGSNLDAIGFNIAFIATHSPKLAIEILRLYAQAHQIKSGDPTAPDEDFALFADEINKIIKDL